MAVVDASVWVSIFKKNDEFHAQAINIIQTLISNQESICIPAIAFSEVAGVIKRTTQDSDTARNAVLYMKDMAPEILVNFGELEPIATKIAINYSIRGADAYYLAVAEIKKSNLYTFDKQQKEAFEEIRKTWQFNSGQ